MRPRSHGILRLVRRGSGCRTHEWRLLSAVNYHEVIAKLVERGTPPDQILDIMSQLDVEIVPVDRVQASAAELLRADTRSSGLSLGDRTCLALASSRKAIALTTDRVWADLDLDITVEVAR